jgi:hypothetical protein
MRRVFGFDHPVCLLIFLRYQRLGIFKTQEHPNTAVGIAARGRAHAEVVARAGYPEIAD